MAYFGSCWLSPAGEVIEVGLHCHTEVGGDICRLRFPAAYERAFEKAGYHDPVAMLCTLGWVKVEAEGDVTQRWFEPVCALTQAQLDALWAMYEAAFARGNYTFASVLNASLTEYVCRYVPEVG